MVCYSWVSFSSYMRPFVSRMQAIVSLLLLQVNLASWTAVVVCLFCLPFCWLVFGLVPSGQDSEALLGGYCPLLLLLHAALFALLLEAGCWFLCFVCVAMPTVFSGCSLAVLLKMVGCHTWLLFYASVCWSVPMAANSCRLFCWFSPAVLLFAIEELGGACSGGIFGTSTEWMWFARLVVAFYWYWPLSCRFCKVHYRLWSATIGSLGCCCWIQHCFRVYMLRFLKLQVLFGRVLCVVSCLLLGLSWLLWLAAWHDLVSSCGSCCYYIQVYIWGFY